MKINPIIPKNFYKTESVGAVYGGVQGTRENKTVIGKMDTITISQKANDQRLVGALSKEIAAEVWEHDQPQRIESLSAQVQEGTYQVAASEVADAILARLFI